VGGDAVPQKDRHQSSRSSLRVGGRSQGPTRGTPIAVKLAQLSLLPAALGLGIVEWAASENVPPIVLATDIAAGWAYLVGGYFTWDSRRPPRLPLLFVATGVAWLAGALTPATLGFYSAPLIHLLLAFPTGRLPGRSGTAVVVAGYLYTVVSPLAGLEHLRIALLAAVTIVAIRNAIRSPILLRPARVAAAGAAVAVTTVTAIGALPIAGVVIGFDVLRSTYAIVLGAVGLGLGAQYRWGGRADDTVARLVVQLGADDGTLTLRSRLANALGDPSVVIGLATETADRYVDETGRIVELPQPGSGRSVTPLTSGGDRIGVLVQNDGLDVDNALVTSVAAAAQLALTNARLQADIRRRIVELAASRRRLVEAADVQRSRINRELQTGAELRHANVEALLSEPGGDAELLDEARAAASMVRKFARGIGAAPLVRGGLVPAVGELVRRSPVPVDVELDTDRLPSVVETTAYFVCSESLANVAKHARASRVTVHGRRRNGWLDLEIADDGVGGARLAGGSGLRGLADRVEALGGRLTIEERQGGGTRIAASLPLEIPAAPQ
jgi:signal transduction histidine kinase